MLNKIIPITGEEIRTVKKQLESAGNLFVAEIEGNKCKHLADYLQMVSNVFQFPIEAKGIDSLNDWLRDLSWIDSNNIVFIIYHYSSFLKNEKDLKSDIMDDLKNLILPWWESEVSEYMVGGVPKQWTVYLVD